MPIFDPDKSMSLHGVAGSRYGFSATRVDHLGAAEWTLVAIACDVSGSVGGFERDIEGVLESVAEACRLSPRADHLMLRAVAFDQALREVHGYKPLTDVRPGDYAGALAIGGSTALHDAAHNTVGSLVAYAQALTARGMAVNALLFVITDGEDNASTLGADAVKTAIADAVTAEALESIETVLVGVNTASTGAGRALMDFSARAGFDHFLDLARADARTLAGLADFVSTTIAARSMLLGSGQSTPLRPLGPRGQRGPRGPRRPIGPSTP